jgi:hypothetical protein
MVSVAADGPAEAPPQTGHGNPESPYGEER